MLNLSHSNSWYLLNLSIPCCTQSTRSSSFKFMLNNTLTSLFSNKSNTPCTCGFTVCLNISTYKLRSELKLTSFIDPNTRSNSALRSSNKSKDWPSEQIALCTKDTTCNPQSIAFFCVRTVGRSTVKSIFHKATRRSSSDLFVEVNAIKSINTSHH